MINNRQNGRRRGRGGGGQRPGGNQGGQRDNGNRIDNRARGNANQLYEKYKNMASDAQRQGDRVNTEYYLQFADHYFRVLSDQRGRFEEQNQRRQQADQFDDDGDDFGDEGEPIRADEQNVPRREGQNGRGEQGRRDDYRRDRDDRSRDDGQRYDGGRDYVTRGDGDRDEHRPERINGEARYLSRDEQAAETSSAPVPGDAEPAAEPRRRGRPRKVREENGEAPAGFDAEILPPSLGLLGEPGNNDEAEDRPRRRRGRPPASEVQAS